MSNPTSNFGWQMPTATDLVTDLPADFEVFGQAVDTDLADLNGGTTGQLLSKTSNTDLDFTWVTPNAGDITGVTAGTGISGGGTSGVIQHTAAVIEDAVIRGLNGTDAAETIAEGVRAIEREHAALREVGGDEAELTSRLIEDDRVAEDGQGAEEISRTVATERPVTRADLDHA